MVFRNSIHLGALLLGINSTRQICSYSTLSYVVLLLMREKFSCLYVYHTILTVQLPYIRIKLIWHDYQAFKVGATSIMALSLPAFSDYTAWHTNVYGCIFKPTGVGKNKDSIALTSRYDFIWQDLSDGRKYYVIVI